MSIAAGPNVPVHRFLAGWVEAESTFGVPPTDYPPSAPLRLLSARVSGDHPTQERTDAHATGTAQTPIPGKRSGSATLEAYLMPPGTSGTDPQLAAVLAAGLRKVNHSGNLTVSGSGSSTTQIDVTDASAVTVGLPIMHNGYVAFVISVDTGATPDNITVDPPLPAAPADTETVYTGVGWWADDSRDTGGECRSLAGWFASNRILSRVAGWIPESIQCSFGGDGAAKLTAEGRARSTFDLLKMSLGATLSAGALTATVDNAHGVPPCVQAAADRDGSPLYFEIIDSSNGNEIVRVTGKPSDTTLTIVRAQLSTSDVDHASGSVIVPYTPASSSDDDIPPPSTAGYMVTENLAGARVEHQLETAQVTIGLGINARENEAGDDFVLNGASMATREISFSAQGWGHDATMARMSLAQGRAQLPLLLQQGVTPGAVCGAWSPRVLLTHPERDYGSEEMRVSLDGRAYGGTQDEFCLFTI